MAPERNLGGGEAAPLRPSRVLALASLAGLAGVVAFIAWRGGWSLELVLRYRADLAELVRTHYWSALLAFMATYVAAVMLAAPGVFVLTLTGGFLFGWLVGGLATVVAATVGAAGLFLLVRYALSDFVRARLGPRLAVVTAGFRADAFSYLLFLRLVPAFPFFLVNLAAALAGVRLSTFLLSTLIGILPATFAFAVFGAGIDSVLARDGRPLGPGLFAALTALGIAALIPVLVRRLRERSGRGGMPAANPQQDRS